MSESPHTLLPRVYDSRANDQNRVLNYLFVVQDGDYGCGFNRVMLHLCGSTRILRNKDEARVRASLALDWLVGEGLVTIRTFIGMEEFQLTEKGEVVASHLKI